MKSKQSIQGSRILLGSVLCLLFFLGIGMLRTVGAAIQNQSAYTIYVSPDGRDSNPGTLAQPIKTLREARQRVRATNQVMTGDITVFLRGGTHTLTEPLVLDSADSGMNGYNVIYRNYGDQMPVISGGRTIGGWQQEGRIWKSQVGGGLPLRQLYVDGFRAVRARTDPTMPVYHQKTTLGYVLAQPDIRSWQDLSTVEFVGFNRWKEFRCPVDHVEGNVIVMQQPCWNNAQLTETPIDSPAFIENAFELLDQPGEWYFRQSTGWLYYYPYAGQDMNTASVVAPTLETLVEGLGTVDNPVHNIQFRGLQFSYGTWLEPSMSNGYVSLQANIGYHGQNAELEKVPAAVALHSAENVVIDRSLFSHLGTAGLSFDDGSKSNTITANHFTDISATGVQVGDFNQPNPSDSRAITENNVISNNYFQDVSREYQDGVGMWLGHIRLTEIQHNEITNVPYTAISIGWGWSAEDTVARDNHIKYNDIHDHVLTLTDGGGIYSLGVQPGIVIAGNVILNQKNLNGGIYLDDGSRYIFVHDNVLFNNARSLLVKGGDHVLTNNWWQDRYPGDLWFIAPRFGPNDVSNNNVIDSLSQAPTNILNEAGLEPGFTDVKNLSYPTNLRHSCDASGQNVELTWNAARESPNYTLSLDDMTNNDAIDGNGWFQPGSSDASQTVSGVSTNQPVACGQEYRWWIHVVGDLHHMSSKQFTCGCPTPIDSQAPSVPTNLTVNTVTSSSISLSWSASVDNTRVSGYEIFRNGTLAFEANTESFTDVDLAADTSYAYAIRSRDDAGNVSDFSTTMSIRTASLPSPTVAVPPVVPEPASSTPPTPPVQVLGTEVTVPKISIIKLRHGTLKIKKGKQLITLHPFGKKYQGSAWSRKVEVGQEGIFYLFMSNHRVDQPTIVVYNEKGKKTSSVSLPKSFFAAPKNSEIYYDASAGKLFILVSDTNHGATAIFSLAHGRLKKVQTLAIQPGKISQTYVKVVRLGSGQNVVAAMLSNRPVTLRVWQYQVAKRKFVLRKRIGRSPLAVKKIIISLSTNK